MCRLCSRQKLGQDWAEVGGGWKWEQLWGKCHCYMWVERVPTEEPALCQSPAALKQTKRFSSFFFFLVQKDWFWLHSLDPFTITLFILLSPFPPFHPQLALWTSVVCECLHPSWSSPMRPSDFTLRHYRRAVLGWSYVMRYGGISKENTSLMFSWDQDKSCFLKGGRWLSLMFSPLIFNLALFWARGWAGESWGLSKP